jgi:hypothetical protein
MEPMRCLERRLDDIVYTGLRTLIDDAVARSRAREDSGNGYSRATG